MLTNFSRKLELADRLETSYLRLLYYDFSDNFSGIYRSYEYSRLCTILEGQKEVSINQSKPFTYTQDQYILLPPNSNVHMMINIPTKALVLELNNHLIKNVSEKVSVQYEIDYDALIAEQLFIGSNSPAIKILMDKFVSLLADSPQKNIHFLLDLYAQELVYNLIQVKGAQQVLNHEVDNPVFQAVKFMKENYQKPINLRQVSADLRMSEANFCYLFKKITGVAPKEYLTDLKLSKAVEMLKTTNVTAVAYDLGYENISHFIALFKNKYGVTPKQYQKRNAQLLPKEVLS